MDEEELVVKKNNLVVSFFFFFFFLGGCDADGFCHPSSLLASKFEYFSLLLVPEYKGILSSCREIGDLIRLLTR